MGEQNGGRAHERSWRDGWSDGERPDTEVSDARAADGTLLYRGQRIGLRGRALKLILWVASRQTRINETAPEAGQMWVTWKGDGTRSIDGDIRAPL